jgi:hypothetical protein
MGPAPDAVKRLVDLSACNAQADHFDQNRDAYLSGSYKEEQLRLEFLEPFFTAFRSSKERAFDTILARNWRSAILFLWM